MRGPTARLVAGQTKVAVDMARGTGNPSEDDLIANNVVDMLAERGVPLEIARCVQAAIRAPEFQKAVRERAKREADDFIASEIAKRRDELEARVRAAVEEAFEETVATTARRLLEDELVKIRRRLGGSNG